MVFTNLRKSVNGADGISDIEGKVARVSGEGVGKRPSFKICIMASTSLPTASVAKTLQKRITPRSATAGYSFRFSLFDDARKMDVQLNANVEDENRAECGKNEP